MKHLRFMAICMLFACMFAMASVWNECHPFVWSDGGFTFPCGWDELCHASLFVEHRDKLPGRMDLSVGNLLSDEDLAIVQDALNEVSTHRSYLGALQNGCEYVDMLCNYVLDNGAIIGNQFGVDPGTGSHTLVNIDDAFQDVIGWMTGRRAKLMEQLEWYETLDPDDVISIACIEEELSVLPHMVDLCVDLLNTRTFNTNKVGVEGLDYAGSAEITENGQSYSYKLTYWNNLSPTRNVALVDHIENGDDTCFAGVVTGVDLSDAEAKGIDVAVFALMLDGAYVPGTDDVPDVLYNTLSVYERVGDDQDVRVHDSEVTTDVVLTYPMDIVVMPETGGPGTGPVCMSGLGVLLCGMMVLIRKCRC